ncbi:uncharacterized protein LOC142319900 [Lycorma delicatula]|uniref:uncharacterized protein LOC142319900 n=1 Tax=Lycorma delicatula TaxID=130591 RepID=UPI003F50E9B2
MYSLQVRCSCEEKDAFYAALEETRIMYSLQVRCSCEEKDAFYAALEEVKWAILLLFLTTTCWLSSDAYRYNRTKNNNRQERSASIWNYFPSLPQNYYDLDYLEVPESFAEYKTPEFRPLCQTVRRRIELQDEEFEFRPPHYVEVICKSQNPDDHGILTNKQTCVYPGFRCVQRTQTIFLTRRRFNSDCWETFTQVIASSCDCMWPVSTLGEIGHHY